MQSNEKNPEIIRFNFRDLPEYAGARERQKQLVEENPFIEIEDSKTYDEARKRRTALRQGRYELQNGQKLITQRINEFKKEVQEETAKLIEITKPHEDTQQDEIERFEAQKRAEKEEKERQEKERIEGIKNAITEYRESMSREIKNMTPDNAEQVKKDLDNIQIDCAEFQQDFDLIRENFYEQYNEKKAALDEAERVRVENEKIKEKERKMEEERKQMENEKLSMRAAQLNALGLTQKDNGNFSAEIAGEEYMILLSYVQTCSHDDFNKLLESAKGEIAKLKGKEKQIEEENEKRKELIAKRKAENDRRIDALEKIGFEYDFEKDVFTYHTNLIYGSNVLVPKGEHQDASIFDNEIFPEAQKRIAEEDARIERMKPEKQRIIEALESIQLPELELEELQASYAEIKYDLVDMIESYKDSINNL